MILNYFQLNIPVNNIGFGQFSLGHIVWLILGCTFTILICKLYKKSNKYGRIRIRKIISLAALFLLVLKEALLLLSNNFTIYDLPLHLCGLTIIFIFIDSLYQSNEFRQYLYAFCLPGALFALIFPDWSYFPLLNILTSIAFESHILIVSYIVMLTYSGELLPSIKYWYKNLILMIIIAIPVGIFNLHFGTNFMFTNYPVMPLTLFSFLGRPLYNIGYIPLIVITWFIIYFPFSKRRN